MPRWFSKKYFVFIIIVIVVIAFAVLIFSKYYYITSVPQTTTPTNGTSTTQELKTYRNKEWGFEFQYPQDLVIEENSFVSYYSKFNLELFTKIGESFDPTFLVNIVLPEFAERSFGGLDKTTTEVVIDGVSGVKYQYEFNNRQEKAVILPLGEYQLILGVYYEEYEDIFNQILFTFKFLK